MRCGRLQDADDALCSAWFPFEQQMRGGLCFMYRLFRITVGNMQQSWCSSEMFTESYSGGEHLSERLLLR